MKYVRVEAIWLAKKNGQTESVQITNCPNIAVYL